MTTTEALDTLKWLVVHTGTERGHPPFGESCLACESREAVLVLRLQNARSEGQK